MATTQLPTSPVNADLFPHPMLDGYAVEERAVMLRIRDFLKRFLQRDPNVTEVVYAYHVLNGMR